MQYSIVTLCLYPFADGKFWAICETVVNSTDSPPGEEIDAFACKSNTLIVRYEEAKQEEAVIEARAIARDRGWPLYLNTVPDHHGPASIDNESPND